MKAFGVAVALAVVFACISVLQSSAVPFSEARMEEAGGNYSPVVAHQETVGGSSKGLPEHFRAKRQSHLSLCRWCCNCCRNKGCGFCCRF